MKAIFKLPFGASTLRFALMISFTIIIFLLGVSFIGGSRALALKDLSVEASDLLVKWNILRSMSQELLLGESGSIGRAGLELSGFEVDWARRAAEFDVSLKRLGSGKSISMIGGQWQVRLDEVSALWLITYAKLKDA
jgi:hypothetical protein